MSRQLVAGGDPKVWKVRWQVAACKVGNSIEKVAFYKAQPNLRKRRVQGGKGGGYPENKDNR